MAAAALSKEDFFALGLELAGHSKWQQYKHERNLERFKEDYGVIPETCCRIWEDLRTSFRLEKKAKPKHFLLAIRFLFKYEDESDLCRFFGIRSKKTVRKWWKIYVRKIEEILESKVRTRL